jgi:LL-diaminopimelate aminotransferase
MNLNPNFATLSQSYLFSTIAKKVAAFRADYPDVELYPLGIGDFTLPITPTVTAAMHRAVDEQSDAATFHGYAPEQGYPFLRHAVQRYYAAKNIALSADEIFISDGAKSDIANILDIFDPDSTILMPEPVYPAYCDVNLMAGRTVNFVTGNKDNGFRPAPPCTGSADIIYICSPNNPTGAVYTHRELQQWVAYAIEHHAVILFDAAYESYVTDTTLPTSIYEVAGATSCAIEFCSLSKSAGFTGTRCGYTVVPKELAAGIANRFWLRRQTTKFNGVAYVVQRGAEAFFTPEGQTENRQNIAVYMNNALTMHEALSAANIWHTGGVNSPYIWLECPEKLTSWQYFDVLLHDAHVITTPGAGFGTHGENYMRLSAFGTPAKTKIAINRLVEVTKKW